MARLRKAHRKSRQGCLSCKRKHVKCGEEQPECQKCIDHGSRCVYNEQLSATNGVGPMRHSGEARSPTSAEPYNGMDLPTTPSSPSKPSAKSTRMEELHLMIHYMNHTCETMSNGSDLIVWKEYIPEEAVQYEFLMDGLFALSSLHLATARPSEEQRFTEIALRYQNAGLRRYTEALGHITEDNSNALFIYAVITTIMAIAAAGLQQNTDLAECTTSLVSMTELLQGMRIVSDVSGQALRFGKLEALFSNVPKKSVQAPEFSTAMLHLRQRAGVVAKFVPPERLGIYLHSIDRLEEVYGVLASSNHIGPIVAWPAMIDKKLVAWFEEEDPMAQLIFLHYGVLLLYTHDRWWGRGFGLRIINTLAAALSGLDVEWASWTRWAQDRAALIMQELQLRSAHHTPSARGSPL